MGGVISKRFDDPDEVRNFPNGEGLVIELGDAKLGLGRLKPGWSYESSMKELVGEKSCPMRHVGYALEGRLRVTMDDGSEIVISAGEGYSIAPGHQAAVEGDEDFVGLEFDSGAVGEFGKQRS